MAIREHTKRRRTYGNFRQSPKTVNQGSDRYKRVYSFRPQKSFGEVIDEVSLPENNLVWWHEGDSVTLSGSDLSVLIDKTSNGHNATWIGNQPFDLTGGPNGTPAWGPTDTAANIANVGIGTTAIQQSETHYFVINNLAPASRQILESNTGWLLFAGTNSVPRQTIIYDGAFRATVTADGGWQLLRFRWNATENAIKYTGQAEVVDSATVNPAGRWWTLFDSTQSYYAGHYYYAEDTIASGQDTAIQAYLLDKFNLVL